MEKPLVLITGALTGIGRATALAFAKSGARLVVSGRREVQGKALEAELRELGSEVVFIRADVRHDEDVRNLVDQTIARFGRIDAAVNNAGTEGQPGPVVSQTADESYAATSSVWEICGNPSCSVVLRRAKLQRDHLAKWLN